MNRLATILAKATERRRALALAGARTVLDGAGARGLAITLIGSLATDRFMLHSDVDFFVHGDTDPDRRIAAEQFVAGAFRHLGIPYDIIYESDLTPARAREFLA